MAIITQYPYVDAAGREHYYLERTYSDAGKTILQLQTGTEYEEAIDTHPSPYTYQETENDIPEHEDVDYETAYKTLAKEVMSDA
jgi:hypothetical protein